MLIKKIISILFFKINFNFTAEKKKNGHNINSVARKIEIDFNRKYKKILAQNDVHLFHAKALSLIVDTFEQGEFRKHRSLIKEIKYFVHYVFNVMQDDYYIGRRLVKTRITRFDDYVFSKYSKHPGLSHNMKKLMVLAYSGRFEQSPKRNLLAYFVFVEENGIDFTNLLLDFYQLMEETDKQDINKQMIRALMNKKYKKVSGNEHGVGTQTIGEPNFQTVLPTMTDEFKNVNLKIYKDEINQK